MAFALKVNGTALSVDVEADTPLLWVLRDELGLTSVKYGCGVAACGACTVLLDKVATRSCSLTIEAAAGDEIVTLEGLAAFGGLKPGDLHPIQEAWIAAQVPQCGYCQSGMMMATAALFLANPHPTEADVAAAITNLCRCGTYPRIKQAIASITSKS